MPDSIGGFPPLELPSGTGRLQPSISHLDGASAFYSGRGAMLELLIANGVSEAIIPTWTCPVVYEALATAGIPYIQYGILKTLQPDWVKIFSHACQNAAVILNSYFGLFTPSRKMIEELRKVTGTRILLDLAQALYEPCPDDCSAFYSPRKFVGIPDGGLLAVGKDSGFEKPPNPIALVDHELFSRRLACLGLRREYGSPEAWEMFRRLEAEMPTGSFAMSTLASEMLSSLDHGDINARRKVNSAALQHMFGLDKVAWADAVPLCFPLLLDGPAGGIREQLVSEGIFVPHYWPGIPPEADLGKSILALPVHQRYLPADIERMAGRVAELMARSGVSVAADRYGG